MAKMSPPPKVKHMKIPNTCPKVTNGKKGTNGKMTSGKVNLMAPQNDY